MLTPFDFKPAHLTQPDRERARAVACAYLMALALSQYSYHIDDPVWDIVWDVPVSLEQIEHLWEMMHIVDTILNYEERWDIYHAASMLTGRTALVLD